MSSHAITTEHIETYVGWQHDSVVHETIESMQDHCIAKPTDVSSSDGTMKDIENKIGKKLDWYFVNQELINWDMKQVYAFF